MGDSKFRRRRIKPSISHHPPKFSSLKSLPCYPDLERKLIEGFSTTRLARWLQEEMHEYTHVTHDSLNQMLFELRGSIAATQLVASRMPGAIEDAKKRIDEGLDELEQLEDLYRKQVTRIDMGMELETRFKMLNPRVREEIQAASGLLMERHKIKMDLGFNGGPNLGTMTVRPEFRFDIKAKYGDDVHKVVSDPEGRGRVMDMVKKLASIAREKREKETATTIDVPVGDQ